LVLLMLASCNMASVLMISIFSCFFSCKSPFYIQRETKVSSNRENKMFNKHSADFSLVLPVLFIILFMIELIADSRFDSSTKYHSNVQKDGRITIVPSRLFLHVKVIVSLP
jgi:hypothetical protein